MIPPTKIHQLIRSLCLVLGVFFLVWAFLSFGSQSDLIFDKFLGAGLFLLTFLFYPHLHLNYSIISVGGFAIFIHQMKLYGNVYFGIEFDVYMHLLGAFALGLFLSNLFITHTSTPIKTFTQKLFFLIIVLFATVGISSLIEIGEFFAYTSLSPGDGILHFGPGDVFGEGRTVGGDAQSELLAWADSAFDQLFNVIGALLGVLVTFLRSFKRAPHQHSQPLR